MNFLIFIIVLFFLLKHYEETVIAMAPLMVLLSMFKVPFLNLSTISLGDVLVIVVLLLYPLHFRFKDVKKYPFHICTLFFCIAFFCSNFWGYEKHWFLSIVKILTIYVFPSILWVCIEDKKSLSIYLKSVLIFSVVLVFYAFFELITNTNPLLVYLNGNAELMDTVTISFQERFGFKRLQSFLPLFGAFGYTIGSFLLIVLYVYLYKRDLMRNQMWLFLLPFMLFCVFLTGTRSVYVSFLVGCFLLYNYFIRYRSLIFSAIPFVLVGVLFFLGPFFSEVLNSFTDTQNVGGSNTDMRLEQFSIASYYFLQSPLFGNGPTFTFTVARFFDDALLGAESIWFVLLIDYGLLGCVAFLFSILYPCYYLIDRGKGLLIFVVFMFFINKSLSSVPGISEGYFFIYLVFFIKLIDITQMEDFVKILKIKFNEHKEIVNNNSSL